MTKYEDIRKYMSIWNNCSFEDGLGYVYHISVEEKNQTKDILKRLNLWDKKMSGNTVELQQDKIKAYEENTIIFSKIFNSVLNNYITPVAYIVDIIRECNKYGYNNHFISRIVLRGYRTFPSFLRELDLASKLTNKIDGATCQRSTPEDDVWGHTDVLLKYNGSLYRVWSYQDSSRGIENTFKRFKGKRGRLPRGLHVLCPIDLFNSDKRHYDEIFGWKMYSDNYVSEIAELIVAGKIDEYDELMKDTDSRLQEYIKQIRMVKV